MNKLKILFGGFITLLTACQSSEPLPENPIDESSEVAEVVNNEVVVSIVEVHKAAMSYKPFKGRSSGYSVAVKKDASETPIFYVINYNDGGFIILSSTKKTEPVLAYSESGYFALDETDNPTTLWQEATSDYIRYAETLPIDSVQSSLYLWRDLLYEGTSTNPILKNTKSRGEEIDAAIYNEIQTIVQNARIEWESNGYKTYSITEMVLDEAWHDYAIQRAKDAIFPIYEDYWEDFSFMVEHDESVTDEKEILIKTKWTQGSPYNKYCFLDSLPTVKGYVGCGPLAVGQIMYYYEFPKSFDWDGMKTGTSANICDNIAKMLSEIGNGCLAEYKKGGTSVNIGNVRDYMNKFWKGSNKTEIVKNPPAVPCIVRGSGASADGHEWIEGGKSTYTSRHYYVCWGITEYNRLTDFETSPIVGLNQEYRYVVWGWGGRYDGWYLSTYNKFPDTGSEIYDIEYLKIPNPN